MPRFTITDRQRAPVYRQIRRHLTSIDDVRVLADADPEEAARLALQFADDFRLLEDLGWNRDDPRETIRLTMPPTDLRRALMRLQAEAEGGLSATAEEEREEKEERVEITRGERRGSRSLPRPPRRARRRARGPPTGRLRLT
jgi:hypothetical protein